MGFLGFLSQGALQGSVQESWGPAVTFPCPEGGNLCLPNYWNAVNKAQGLPQVMILEVTTLLYEYIYLLVNCSNIFTPIGYELQLQQLIPELHPCSWLGETRLRSSWPPGSLLLRAHITVCADTSLGFLWLSLWCSQSTGLLLTCTALRSWGEVLLPLPLWYGQLSSVMSVNCRKTRESYKLKNAAV